MNVPSQSKFEIHLGNLYQRINYERQSYVAPKSFDLSKMQGLVQRLGSPELKYPVIHVAGTKGKGSVCTMLGSILTAAGFNTGVYTSPHLETIHQRMCVNGKMVSDEQMLEVFEYFAPIVDQYDRWLESQNRRRVTFFEFTTAMAMQFFANQRCDAVVLETGLGGRLDSTNVCQPQLCIITNISLDHTKQLGNRLEKIAFEKSGIIKPNIPVVSGVVGPPSQAVVEDIAAQRSSPLVQRDREFWVEPTSQPSGQRKQIGGEDRFQFRMKSEPAQIYIEDLQTQMLGRHQWDNAALAIAAAIELRSAGWKIDNHAIRKGLADATLAGRMEQVNSRPVVIMDMAHNPASVAAFAAYLNQDKRFKTGDSRRSLVFATTREKDCEKMLAVLLPLFDRIVLTQYQNNPRAMPTQTMESICQKLGFSDRTFVKPTPLEAWEHVFLDASEDDFIGVAGSAFLLAELRSRVIAACQKRG